MSQKEWKLAAIMFSDMVGYRDVLSQDESLARHLLAKQRSIIRHALSTHRGEDVGGNLDAGEGTGLRGWITGRGGETLAKLRASESLVLFENALDATRCAVEIQRLLTEHNEEAPSNKDIYLRIGIHVGNVAKKEREVSGEAVAVASRIASVAEEGGVCVTGRVRDHVWDKVDLRFSSLGTRGLKGVQLPIEVYKVELPWSEGQPAEESGPDKTRIAVLPFVNLSPDPNEEYFADGMTEEIISTISKIDQIGVISRTSVMQYKKVPKPVQEVSRELGVSTVLEGSVRKAGNRIRITVQMIDAVKDRHLWVETYDRDLQDVFAIQTDIATQVAEALKVKMLPHTNAQLARKPTTNTEAYTLYLKGRYHWNKRGLEDLNTAAEFFRQAIDKDPTFALGYAGLGDYHQTVANNYGVDVDENHKRAGTAVAKALELDPDLAEAHASMGHTLFSDFDMRNAEKELIRATELKPSYASAHQWYSQLLIAQTRWDEALSHIERAAELDPFSPIIVLIHVFFYEAKRDYRSGLKLAKRAAEANPGSAGLHIELALFYGKQKMFNDARREAGIGVKLAEGSFSRARTSMEAMLAYLVDDKPAVRRLLPELEAHLGETFTAVRFIADLRFYLGEVDKGFEWLEESYRRKEVDLVYLKSNEFLDGLRADPRYLDLLKRLGLE